MAFHAQPPPALSNLFLGVFILALALIAWRATGSVIGWLVLFAPGSAFVVVGVIKVLKDWR